MTGVLKKLKCNIIVCGHFGCGKTNVSVGLALAQARVSGRGALVDLDIVNPYFRAADAATLMKDAGIDLIVPRYANTNVDLPSLGGDISSVFAREGADPEYRTVFDVGGDNGAVALGRYNAAFTASGYSMIYVVSKYRPLTADVSDAVADLREIETYSRLRASFIINNSNIGAETTLNAVENSLGYAEEIAAAVGIPLLCTTLHSKEICGDLRGKYPGHNFAVIPDSTKRLF